MHCALCLQLYCIVLQAEAWLANASAQQLEDEPVEAEEPAEGELAASTTLRSITPESAASDQDNQRLRTSASTDMANPMAVPVAQPSDAADVMAASASQLSGAADPVAARVVTLGDAPDAGTQENPALGGPAGVEVICLTQNDAAEADQPEEPASMVDAVAELPVPVSPCLLWTKCGHAVCKYRHVRFVNCSCCCCYFVL